MKIRPYTAEDDPALMHLERQCPRGQPDAFVHYRRRFVDRAALYKEYMLLLVEAEGEAVAVAAAALKNTQVKGIARRLAYVFDVRVAPKMRRLGLAQTLLEELEEYLLAEKCDGAYAHIVATNSASLKLFGKLGYARQRQLRYLTYQPMPLFYGTPVPVVRHKEPRCNAHRTYHEYDLWLDDVAQALQAHDFECWKHEGTAACISLYDQSQVFQQTSYDAPWPNAEEIARRGRHWRLFHPLGPADALEPLFDTVRDQAVSENISKLTMLVDAEDPIPSFFYAATSEQREYVVVTRSFTDAWDGTLGKRMYCDTREL